jgi:hypothetical protein
LKGAYSFIEVDKEVSKLVQDNLHGMEYKGRMVRVEVTSGAGEGGGASRGGSRSGGSRERSYSSSSKSRSYGSDSRTESRGSGDSRSSYSRKRSYSGTEMKDVLLLVAERDALDNKF